MLTEHDFLPVSEHLNVLPELPEALVHLKAADIINDPLCTLITQALKSLDTTDDTVLATLVPREQDSRVLRQRFSTATRIVIARIYSCLPQGSKGRYAAMVGVTQRTLYAWRKLPYPQIAINRTTDSCITVMDTLESLPTPIPKKMLTTDIKRVLVLGYALSDFGSKQSFLRRFGIDRRTLMDWTAAMTDGDLDNDKIPRKVGTMTHHDVREIMQLKNQVLALQKENNQLKETNAALAASLREDYVPADKFTQLEQVVDALGKAIKAMPKHGENSDKAENASPQNNKKSMTPDAK